MFKLPLKSALFLSASALLATSVSATPPGFNEPGMGQMPMRTAGDTKPRAVQDWWPEVVDLARLRQNEMDADPMGEDFDYAAEFAKLDLDEVKADVAATLTDSKDWWPADYGSYTGLFIRLAWHSAGTYRSGDGRGGSDGGQIRFEPLNSWPDNGNLDKARRLLWPVKQKYGRALSWSDLIILSGNVALEQAGFDTFGFAGGRTDDWQPELVYWGPESKFLTASRFSHGGQRPEGTGEAEATPQELEDTLGASEMGLIYVNPEGPEGNMNILESAERIRTTFGRMGMNDEETAALIIGGHTLGKNHGASKKDCIGKEPAAESVAAQGFGWKNSCGTGAGPDATTSGLEGAWTATPITWSSNYLENLYNFEWRETRSPAGAGQWIPVNADQLEFVPDAFDPEKFHPPVMLTTDLAMRYDPKYGAITKRWAENPEEMDAAFAKAWFKLTHRDMGPAARYVGSEVPSEQFSWQDPLPAADYGTINEADIAMLEGKIRASGLATSELVRTAWASAVTYRDTDMRGGANGSRIRLAPQKDWAVNDPEVVAKVVNAMEGIQADFNARGTGRMVSIADLIVLGGGVAIEDAAKAAGYSVDVPFTPGRVDATQEMTDADGFEYLRPAADGFRNFYSERARLSPAEMLVDRADLLTLSVPEMTVLVAGMRALDANTDGAKHGVFTDTPGELTNDFFVNLLDMGTQWAPVEGEEYVFEGRDRESGEVKWTATEVDLVFGSNSELRAVAEVYAYSDGEERFVNDFAKAWSKVMMLDRFDVK
ncbi:catalase/peroxidase HPI [Qipengyuania sp. S6317L1]|uniref:catalase/peroxidase HPI n=1 Tax=Qipengyuania sp. S6317L1 TaxID=2926410 RepID=UPI001FF4BDDF|nr:catalase/peroxidase HPI [Qipengyuania sp. S6317L1]MCK0098001.1 catalase/peroxidase HPI [Qipengyuania sp. S6317L1]